MGLFVGALFGVSLMTALLDIFDIPFDRHGWHLWEWDIATLQTPGFIWTMLIAFSIAYGWSGYRRDRELVESEPNKK